MLTIRKATPNDAEQIARIHDETWKLTYGPLIANEDLEQVRWKTTC